MAREVFDSPIGAIAVEVEGGALCRLEFTDERPHRDGDGCAAVIAALDAYFHGDVTAIDAIDVAPAGTGFQREVWAALRAIEPGTTVSYADIARAVGRPRAVRAVGQANGANPTAIVVPCHRVVRADGAVGGYAYGLDRKHWLLRHEASTAPPQP